MEPVSEKVDNTPGLSPGPESETIITADPMPLVLASGTTAGAQVIQTAGVAAHQHQVSPSESALAINHLAPVAHLEQQSSNQHSGSGFFPNAQNFVISGGTFVNHSYPEISGSEKHQVLSSIERDKRLNGYTPGHPTIKVPLFAKDLLLNLLKVATGSANTPSQIPAGSCAFDVAALLGLLPGQPHNKLYLSKEILITEVPHRGQSYCGYISRHGLVALVSHHIQSISLEGNFHRINISTDIGKFKIFEHDDTMFVHFDSTTRSSHVPLLRSQNFDEIQKTARGEYRILVISQETGAPDWRYVDLSKLSTAKFESKILNGYCATPAAVFYMPRHTIQWWNHLKEFSLALSEAVDEVMHSLKEPAELVRAMGVQITPGFLEEWASNNSPSPVNAIVQYVHLMRLTLKIEGFLEGIEFKSISAICGGQMNELHKAHRGLTHRDISLSQLFELSVDFFQSLLHKYISNPYTRLGDDLESLLASNPADVALVVCQGTLALQHRWNAIQILRAAREAPQEWLDFVFAEDSLILMG